ncbi:MAG: winged helix-turn-helix transcriptional regulator [Eubacteriales bacterium]
MSHRKGEDVMSEVRSKQDEMMRMFEVLENIRPEGERRHGPHGKRHKGHGERARGEGECHCKQKPDDGIRIPPSARKLLCVLLREGSLNQRNIANMTNVTAQAVSEIIKKLEQKELIQKGNGEINNENIISLTEKGVEIANEIETQTQKYAEELFAGFTEEEMENLHNLMDKLYENKRNISDK